MFAIIISAVMVIVAIVLVIMMVSGGQKETYFGYMKNSTTADKVVSEKDHEVEENVKIPITKIIINTIIIKIYNKFFVILSPKKIISYFDNFCN